jgi:hypothetical protein
MEEETRSSKAIHVGKRGKNDTRQERQTKEGKGRNEERRNGRLTGLVDLGKQ